MYKTYEKQEAVREIQRYLAYLSDTYIAPSGVYDSATKEAVILIQEKHSLTPDGIVNKETFDVIYSEYTERKIKDDIPSKMNFPITVGDYSEDILQIKKMLITVTESYGIYHTMKHNALYDNSANKAQKEISKVFGLKSDTFDEFFYYTLKKEYEFLIKQEALE